MGVKTIARRYASSLADVAIKSDNVELVKSELNAWEKMLTSYQDLRNVFHNPSITHKNKERVLESLLERVNSSKMTANFLRILLKNRRFTELGEVNGQLLAVLQERSGLISASVISSRELSKTEEAKLKSSLRKMTGGKEVKLSFEIDENVIGGIVIKVGSTVYDGSVRTQLELLKEQMIKI